MNAFLPADILFPQVDSMEKWAVIACDQFTSDPAYWERVRQHAEGSPSTINLILPEAELGTPQEAAHTALINRTMAEYLDANVFRTLKDSFVDVERTLKTAPSAAASSAWSIWMLMTTPPAPFRPSAPQSARSLNAFRRACASAAKRPSSCRTS